MRYEFTFQPEPFRRYQGFDESLEFNSGLVAQEWQHETNRSGPAYTRWVQSSLNKILGLRLVEDGISGPATRSAIRSFQQKNGLTVDGIVGPQTEAALKAALAGAPSITTTATGSRLSEGCEVLDNFNFDQEQLKPEHRAKLAAIASRIINSQSSSVRLVGHTDPVGDDAYNLALGKRRAQQVANELCRALEGMKPGSTQQIVITIESRGEREPISNNPAQNRRVQICVPPSMAQHCVVTPTPSLESELPLPWPSTLKLPSFRTCCMFRPPFADPTNLGKHGDSNEGNGQIYTGKAGFLDLAHIRDSCDMTKYIFDQLTRRPGSTPSKVFAAYAIGGGMGRHLGVTFGEAVMYGCPPQPLDVARAIAYDVGLGHEITSYVLYTQGGHNSSFSPEDLCSNFLGTVLAERAIAAGGNFNSAVTAELNTLISNLDGQIPSESLKAFNRINGLWVHWIYNAVPPSVRRSAYLRRRNFTRNPWKAGHPSDKPTPHYVTAPIPNASSTYSFYSYTHKELGKTRPASGFNNEIAQIKQDARARYGSNFDKP